MVSKEQLKSRLEELLKEKEKTQSFVLVIDGAMQDCEYWLKKLEESESEKKS